MFSQSDSTKVCEAFNGRGVKPLGQRETSASITADEFARIGRYG
ncbi:MAG: hypothetical protein ACR2MD_19650 [Aridibacter sp.]